jgi:uncharacterized protein (DUF2345 family)
VSVREAVSIFVHKLGIKLIAASGKVRIEAQNDAIEVIAKRVVDIMSTTDWINLKANQGIRLNAGGTQVEISAEGYIVHTEGKNLVHAGSHQTEGPQSHPLNLPSFPSGKATLAFRYSL